MTKILTVRDGWEEGAHDLAGFDNAGLVFLAIGLREGESVREEPPGSGFFIVTTGDVP
jgi:hypothetical protein